MTDIKLGFVDYTALVYIPDPASTDGSGKTGLVAANLTVSYSRVETDNDVTVTDVTSSLNNLAALTSTHNDWGLLEVSNTLAPGLYRLDIADAVFATGAWSAVVYVMITTSAAAASPIKFDLIAYDRLDTVRLGLTALPNAAADAAGGLPISDAGGLDMDAISAKVWDVDATGHQTQGTFGQAIGDPAADTHTIYAATVTDATGVTVGTDTATLLTRMGTPADLGGGATLAGNLSDIEGQTDDIGVAGAGLTNINLPNQTMDIIGNITGNLSGSVGSVTGAVGSVTGLTAADVGAIKVTTDKFVFTVANNVNANIQYVNDVLVNGVGSVGNPWGP